MTGLLGSDRQSLLYESLKRAGEWLGAEMCKTGSGFYGDPKPGHARGIEFYSGMDLHRIVASSIAIYASGVGRWPNLIEPVTFTEKLLWYKFFGYLPVPSPADKLLVQKLIPAQWRDKVTAARVFWQSERPTLPPPEAAPKGRHYVKMNNATASNMLLDFPIQASDRFHLERWLSTKFAPPRIVAGGEWWYGTIKPKFFIEKAICQHGSAREWQFYVFNGKCQFLYERVPGKVDQKTRYALYDRNFRPLQVQLRERPTPSWQQAPEQYEAMLGLAEDICSKLSFARIDFMIAPDGQTYLGEVTFCPFNTQLRFTPASFDEQVGEAWDHMLPYRRGRE